MTTDQNCPTIAELADFLADRQGGDTAVERHLETCVDCQRRLTELADVDDAVPSTPCPADLRSSGDSALLADMIRSMAPPLGTAGMNPAARARDRIGDYELVSVLGQGGIGVVYLATDSVLRRSVAIKMLRPNQADNPAMRERFLREARSAAALRHDNVVAIYGVSEHEGRPYLVMEYVEGGSLADRLREHGPLSPAEVARLGAEVASGLAAAHAKGIIHRDIKPGNVLWDSAAGRYKLTDFGLAKALDDVSLTRTGIVVGTPEFLSPEQAEGRPVDARSDLFSLGAVLHAACVGESPFHADSTLAVLNRVCTHVPPPLDQVCPMCPAALARLVARLLEKKPDRRIGSANEVVDRLRQMATGATLPVDSTRPILATGVPAHLGLRPSAVAIGLALAALAVGGIWYTARRPQPVSLLSEPPAELPKRGFVVVGQSGVFDTLPAAVAAAPSDGVIEIYGSERLQIAPVQISGKPLTIRAAAGHRPVLVPTGGRPMTAPAIGTDSNLTLRGLGIQWTVVSPSDGGDLIGRDRCAVKALGGTLRIENCEIETGKDTDCMVVFGPQCELRDNRLSARQARCVCWAPKEGHKLRLDNCALWGRSCVAVLWHEPGRQALPATVEVVRNSWRGQGGLEMVIRAGSKGPLTFDTRHNVFGVDHALAFHWGLRGPRADEYPTMTNVNRMLSNVVRWQERENIYSATCRFVSWSSPRLLLKALPGSPADLAAWEKFWEQSGTGSRQGPADELKGKVGADDTRVGPQGTPTRSVSEAEPR